MQGFSQVAPATLNANKQSLKSQHLKPEIGNLQFSNKGNLFDPGEAE